jgi:diacylglycerol kinase (ATP)
MENKELKNKPNGSGFGRIIRATHCSILGFKAALKHEAAFRQELALVIILTPIALFICDTLVGFVSVFVAMLFVLIVELLNSAIEAVVDRVGLERHELSGRAKDFGSAAVTLSLVVASFVWLVQIVDFLTRQGLSF